jgi:hypothetical protein
LPRRGWSTVALLRGHGETVLIDTGGGELSAGMRPPIPAASAAPPGSGDYGSFATFSDPDGNGWVLQEVKVRAPGR